MKQMGSWRVRLKKIERKPTFIDHKLGKLAGERQKEINASLEIINQLLDSQHCSHIADSIRGILQRNSSSKSSET